METFRIPGNTWGTALWIRPISSSAITLDVRNSDIGGHGSVVVRPEWLRPLAAWFAGEAEPVSLGDPGSTQLYVVNDEAAVVWSTHTWARLRCRLPFGTAVVTAGPRGKDFGRVVMLSPEARQQVAGWLRRVDAEHRTTLTV